MIRLDTAGIDAALPLVAVGLEKYCRLQADLHTVDVSSDRAFQKRFNGFYRIRRNAEWQSVFYRLFQKEKAAPQPFADVLRALYEETGRVEASFASKLVASVDPGKPVIDSFVLKNLDILLPKGGAVETRLARIADVHERIGCEFTGFLSSDIGRYLATRFAERYSGREVTPAKMLDLVLWQTRPPPETVSCR